MKMEMLVLVCCWQALSTKTISVQIALFPMGNLWSWETNAWSEKLKLKWTVKSDQARWIISVNVPVMLERPGRVIICELTCCILIIPTMEYNEFNDHFTTIVPNLAKKVNSSNTGSYLGYLTSIKQWF